MKIKALLCTLVIACAINAPTQAIENEPDGFRGIPWGTSASMVSGLIAVANNNLDPGFPIRIYKRIDDKREFDETPVTETTYGFYNDRFFEATISYDSNVDLHPLPGGKYPNYGNEGAINRSLVKYFGPDDTSKLSFLEKIKRPLASPKYAGARTTIISKCNVIDHKSTSTAAKCLLQFKSTLLSSEMVGGMEEYKSLQRTNRDDAAARAKAKEAAKPDF